MEILKISVTKEDIKNGIPHWADSCPIALASKRELDDGYVVVGQEGVYHGGNRYRPFGMKDHMRFIKFINRFDSNYPWPFRSLLCRPFTISLVKEEK